MRAILVMCVVGCWVAATGAVPVPDKPDPGKIESETVLAKLPQLPLWIQAGGRFSPLGNDLTAAVHVGRMNPKFGIKPLPINDARIACWHTTQILLRQDDPLVRLADGQEKLLPVTEDQPVTLLLVGPALNSGESFGPARLARVGNTFTLLIESWTDNGERRRNVPQQAIYSIHLGNLKAGTYDLRVLWRDMHCDNKLGSLYHWISSKNGVVPFEVGKGAQGAVPMTLKLADLRVAEVPADAKQRSWQRPIFWQRELGAGGNLNGMPAPGLRVGWFDLPKWLAANPANLGDVPGLQLPLKDQPIYAVVLGPSLDTGMWLTPRSIEWQDKKAVLRVDVWRDNEARLQNLKQWPLLSVPLFNGPGLMKPGDYQVEVEWTWLRAPNNRGPYTTEKIPDDMKFLLEPSRQAVSIK